MKNKRIIISAILVFIIFSLFLSFVSADVWVNPYYRKNGTYVQGHWRSSPDGNPYNNWSFPGNINPYTGKVATGNPETYLRNYYNSKSSNTKKIGFSSVDDVTTAVAINNIGKDPYTPPITIGSTIEDVVRAMGSPEYIQTSPKSFIYRNSMIYFDDNWKVQSWDNRYGNLKVSLEGEKSIDVLDIDEYLIDDIFEVIDNDVKEKPAILTDNKTVDDTIEEFLQYLKDQ